MWVYVAERARGGRIGRMLMNALVERAASIWQRRAERALGDHKKRTATEGGSS
jgi:GNAT superfamily N-acetyltransferase